MKRSAALWIPVLLVGLLGLSTTPSFDGSAPEGAGPRGVAGEAPITVFFVRHAETAGSTRTGGDPELSEAGLRRARSLARMLAPAGPTRFFSSEYARTRATLGPLLEACGGGSEELEVVAAGSSGEQLEALRSLEPGTLAVVCGHSNTVPSMVLGLGGEARGLLEHERYGPMLEHHRYDRLFCVTLEARTGRALSSVELGYGEPCPAPDAEGR